MDIPALGAAAAKLREQVRAQESPQAVDAVTAFIVYITADGRYLTAADLDAPVTSERPPTRQEIIAACEAVSSEIKRLNQTEEVTMNVLGNLGRMLGDPNFHMLLTQARQQGEAAVAVSGG